MGESYIIVNLINDKYSFANASVSTHDSKMTGEGVTMLRLKLFGGPSTGEVFYFRPDGDPKTIGRSKNCDISLDDAVLSKF